MDTQLNQKNWCLDAIKYGIHNVGLEKKISETENDFNGDVKVVAELDEASKTMASSAEYKNSGHEHLGLSFEQDEFYGFMDFDLMPGHGLLNFEGQAKNLVNFKAQVFAKNNPYELLTLNAIVYTILKKEYGASNNFDKEKKEEFNRMDQLLRESYKSIGVDVDQIQVWYVEKQGFYCLMSLYYFKGSRDLLFSSKKNQSYLSFAITEVLRFNG